jgi:hypothetical protein
MTSLCVSSETYEYYQLPFCQPAEGVKYKTLRMGEVVDANRMAATPYDLAFRVDRRDAVLCEKHLKKDDITKFRKVRGHAIVPLTWCLVPLACSNSSVPQAVEDDWYFQMYYDDLPVWGFIGKVEQIIKGGQKELRYLIFTHVDFEIKYNDDRIVEVNVATDQTQQADISSDIGDGDLPIKFSYSVRWTPTTTSFDERLKRYEKFPLNPVHLEVRAAWQVADCALR